MPKVIRGHQTEVPNYTKRGIFIAFEGGEGSGKSTQTSILKSWFEDHGRTVTLTREPGGTELGKQLRHFLLDLSTHEVAPKTEVLLFAADRSEHISKVILPALRHREVVISDRYIDSFIAYEKGGRNFFGGDMLDLARWATDGVIPDLTVVMDIPPKVGLTRCGEFDRMESQPLDFHERVRATFLELASAHAHRYLVVDADQPSEKIAETIQKRCEIFIAPQS